MQNIKSISLVLVLLALLVGGFFAYKIFFPSYETADITIIKAIKSVSNIKSYGQQVQTQTAFSDRSLKIIGTYLVDTPDQKFASYSTTSLFITGDPRPHVFTHEDIAIKDDVFFRVQTIDPFLIATIKNHTNWGYYKNGTIPKEDASIAIAGPLQDNLAIFSDNGQYLTNTKKIGIEVINGQTLTHYTFTLSKKAFTVGDGPLNAVVGRVGKDGVINVWINPSTFAVEQLLFTNAPYFSTTTIFSINAPLPIVAPIPVPVATQQ
jgi:hypothetical protein